MTVTGAIGQKPRSRWKVGGVLVIGLLGLLHLVSIRSANTRLEMSVRQGVDMAQNCKHSGAVSEQCAANFAVKIMKDIERSGPSTMSQEKNSAAIVVGLMAYTFDNYVEYHKKYPYDFGGKLKEMAITSHRILFNMERVSELNDDRVSDIIWGNRGRLKGDFEYIFSVE